MAVRKTPEEQELCKILEDFARNVEKPSRFAHTQGVVAEAVRLAEKYGADPVKAEIAAWFHDTFKPAGALEHGPLAAEKIQEYFGITDPDILNALRYHTTGRAGMSRLEMVLYAADCIEPGRTYPQAEKYRAIEREAPDLEHACCEMIRGSVAFVKMKGLVVDPKSLEAIDWFEQRFKGEYMDNRELALLCAKTLDARKANDIVILDVAEKSGFADYFVIAGASSLRQLESLTDELEDKLAEQGVLVGHIEGKGESGWILMDFGDIIVNLFTAEQREKYQIEKIWKDCVRIDFEPAEE